MRTDDLIEVLAADAGPVDAGALRRQTLLAALAALVIAAAAVGFTIGFRADLLQASALGATTLKLVFAAGLAVTTLGAFLQSLRPGQTLHRRLMLVGAPLAYVLAWALISFAVTPASRWGTLILGDNWLACVTLVPLYALLPLAALSLVARFGAPVRPRITGVLAGMAAAALALLGYALHCPDDSGAFVAAWYSLAVGLSAALGGLLVPRFLRW